MSKWRNLFQRIYPSRGQKSRQAYWQDLGNEKPWRLNRKYLRQWKVTAWCAIYASQAISQYNFSNPLSIGAGDKHTFTSYFLLMVPILLSDIMFQQNGALSKYTLELHQFLNAKLQDSWIRKRDLIICWPRSLDLGSLIIPFTEICGEENASDSLF